MVLLSSQTTIGVINLNRFSNWNILLRVNGWLNQFLINSHSTKDQRKQGSLDIDELQDSEKEIIINAGA